MRPDRKSRHSKTQRRRLVIETLETRQLLAVDGIRINLGGSGGTDLLAPTGGGSVHEGYLNRPIGLTLNTGNVPGQNNAPPVANPDSRVMGQNDPAVEFPFATLLANDSDPDAADQLTLTAIDASETLGSVTYDEANSRVIYDPNGQLNFLADGQDGSDTFRYTITDGRGGTATGTVTITINGINDPPSFIPGADISVDEDTGPQSIGNWATDITDGDSETDELVFEITTISNPGLFRVAPAIDTAGNLTFTAAEHAVGDTDISLRIDDGRTSNHLSAIETFRITVNPVNDAPTFDLIANIDADIHDGGFHSAVVSNVTPGPDNESGQTVAVAVASNSNPDLFRIQPSLDEFGTLTFTPSTTGTATLTVTAIDDGGTDRSGTNATSKQLLVTISERNRPPVLLSWIGSPVVNEGESLNYIANAIDINDDALTFSLTNAPGGMTISDTGRIAWTPTEADGGASYLVDVTVSDGEFSDTATAEMMVNEVNVAPALAPISDVTIEEGVLLSFTANASDADEPVQDLTFSLDSNAPAGAAITPGGEFSWIPDESAGPADHTFGVIVNDGIASSIEMFTVAVDEVNTPPALEPVGDQFVDEGEPLAFTASANDPDRPENDLVFSLLGSVPEGAVITPDGEFNWTPSELQGGSDYSFYVEVTDGQLTSSVPLVITVNDVNEAPILDPIGNSVVAEGELLTFTATATDVDLPADSLLFGLVGDVPRGATIKSDGVFEWRPTEDQFPGVYTFDVEVSDGALSDSKTVTITLETPLQEKYPIDGIVDFSGLPTRTESIDFGVSGTSSSITIGFENDDRDLYVALEWTDPSFNNEWYLTEATNYDEIVLQIDGNGNNVIDPDEDFRWVRATNTGSFYRDAYFDGVRDQDDIVGDGRAKIRYYADSGKYQAEFLFPLANDIHAQDSTIGAASRYQLIVRDGYQPYEGILNQALVFAESDLPLIPVQEPAAFYGHPQLPTDLTGLIVYVSTHEEPNGEIYTFDPATGESFRVTYNTLAEQSVSLSRDRTKIAFDAFIDRSDPTTLEIFSINVDGTQLQQLTNDANANAHPAWSPDGTRLTYSPIFPDSPGITIISESGEFIQDLTPAGIEDHDAEYLPDGRIVFKTNRWSSSPQYLTGVMNEDGSSVQQLTFTSNVSDHDPFGNDDAVIFERFPKGTDYGTDPEGVTLGWDLIETPLDGSGEITLLSDGWMNTFPVYDPSGEYILYRRGPAYFEANLMTRSGEILGRFIPNVTQIKFIDWR